MVEARGPQQYKYAHLSDEQLLNDLKALASQWFKNDDVLLLEELFRRYNRAKSRLHLLTNK